MGAPDDRDAAATVHVDGPPDADGARPRVVSSDTLLRGDAQLAILHERTLYYLRRTRFGKLILTK